MSEMDIYFEQPAWETLLEDLKAGDTLNGASLLAILETEEEEVLQTVLDEIAKKGIAIHIDTLPRLQVSGEFASRLAMEEKLVAQENWINSLEKTDPLRIYMEEINQISTTGDPESLAESLIRGDHTVVSSLTDLMLCRVICCARKYTGRGVLLLDLIQEGSLGLWQGLQQYTGGDIYHYCDWWIDQAMVGAVLIQAKANEVGQKLRCAMEDYRDVDQKLLTRLGRNPTIEEMAEALHMTVPQAMMVAENLENAQRIQREKAPQTEEQAEEHQAVEDTAYFQMRQRIAELLSVLPQEDAKLLTMRYGLEGGTPMKPQEIAVRLGMTAQEVTERETLALAKLRQEN